MISIRSFFPLSILLNLGGSLGTTTKPRTQIVRETKRERGKERESVVEFQQDEARVEHANSDRDRQEASSERLPHTDLCMHSRGLAMVVHDV
mmetsp:Transcript_21114/g.54881  ORF Transcript_21114/g.54881 Transcript_21114/m.54881 type:complete len:92 (-) Transcript_21114:101-376(-)